ncbi:MAG: GC-type dockerin domain-anchored protein [Phycisphaerales bacterium]|nr:GC-type dockerin domain-anchored protein [Phycisphaerales bacterium]
MTTYRIAVVLLALNSTALANTWSVPGDFSGIQEALDAASSGDTVFVGPGTYAAPFVFQMNCKLISTDGPATTIIDGSATSASLVEMIHKNETTMLQGFTIRGADGGTPVSQDGTLIVGGGLRILAGGPVIDDCIFENNHSGYGGAIHSGGSTATISNCSFNGNSASANGGGVLIINGSVPLTNCTFTANHSTLDGGALHVVNGEHSLTDCVVNGNTSIDGGGISWHGAEGGFPLPVVRCSIINNEAVSVGGGLRGIVGRPPVVFVDSTVCDNSPDEFDSPWIDDGGNTLCICPPDINGNGSVDINDLLVVVAQWATSGPQGDIDRDGVVDITDLLETIDEFGPCEM